MTALGTTADRGFGLALALALVTAASARARPLNPSENAALARSGRRYCIASMGDRREARTAG